MLVGASLLLDLLDRALKPTGVANTGRDGNFGTHACTVNADNNCHSYLYIKSHFVIIDKFMMILPDPVLQNNVFNMNLADYVIHCSVSLT